MNRLGVPTGALFLIAACGGADKTAEEPMSHEDGDVQPCGDSQACAAPTGGGEAPASGHDWSAWQSWDKLSAEPFASEHGSAAFVDVYVSPEHVDAFTSLDGDMPEGMAIVKASYGDAGGAPGEVEALTVMAKMEPAYDPEHGDWYYGVLDPSGTTAMQQGKLEMCIGCHEGAGMDYVFGQTGN